ncbi:tyrosine-type recombinase/integrase [Streptodolium elevatio]|uniref:Tyrosine-type recombinase/integrase n=1 Tax=Streptodolium elevatio TaxID=3157996 RepID=A0ABV3DGN6_9ACTN
MTDDAAPGTALVPRPAGALSTDCVDPRQDWPPEARALRDRLRALVDAAGRPVYGDADLLPDLAGAWIAGFRSVQTRRGYARSFTVWEAYARTRGAHPLTAGFALADAYARYLQTALSLKRDGGGGNSGRPPEYAAVGPPYQPAAQAAMLSGASSFYARAIRHQAVTANPFTHTERPAVAPLSSVQGLLPEETALLISTAQQYSQRAFALTTMLYLIGPRCDELLARDVEELGYDRGHRTLPLTRKGGLVQPVPIPPLAWYALDLYLDGRRSGPLFITRNGHRLTEAEVWKCLRRLAKRAGLPHQDSIHPHVLRYGFITDSLERGDALQDVQDAGHRDPRTTQRYNRRRGQLDRHPGYGLAADLAQRLAPPPPDDPAASWIVSPPPAESRNLYARPHHPDLGKAARSRPGTPERTPWLGRLGGIPHRRERRDVVSGHLRAIRR